MQKICAVTRKPFEISEQDVELYKKLEVPLPTIHPEERHRRKMAFRNEKSLYKRKCDLCKKEIISMFSPDAFYTVYCNECWWSDKWNPLSYGQNFNFVRPFFEQFYELSKRIPWRALDNFDYENAEFCNFSCHNKDCYMLFGSWFNEQSMYGHTVLNSFETTDSVFSHECRYCYELIDCEKCYELFYGQNCVSCLQSWFLFDCRNCQNCLFCYNLRNKKYHIFNKPVSKEEFENTLHSMLGSHSKFQEAIKKFRELAEKEAIHKYMTGDQNENCSGNFIYRSKSANDVFYALDVEEITHAIRTTKNQKYSMDIYGNSGGELMYDSMHVDFSYRGKFSLYCEHNSDFAYLWSCYQCEHCFGCIGLRHKKYCILNKEYSKEEYFDLLPRIIEHMQKTKHPETSGPEWGEYLAMRISPFAYNETIAQEFYPLTEDDAKKRGLHWKPEDPKEYESQKIAIPDDIKDAPDAITAETLACEDCRKNYRIIKQELQFYKKYSLPIPRKCFGCRYLKRMSCRPPYKTFGRPCVKCKKQLKSSYEENRPEKVYCEECYLASVY